MFNKSNLINAQLKLVYRSTPHVSLTLLAVSSTVWSGTNTAPHLRAPHSALAACFLSALAAIIRSSGKGSCIIMILPGWTPTVQRAGRMTALSVIH